VKRRVIKSLGSAVVAGSLALAGAATVGVAPASAAEQCNTNTRSLNLPGKPDVTLNITLCVSGSGSYRQAMAYFSWSGHYGYIGGTRLNSMWLQIRLERYDGVQAAASSYYTAAVDAQYSGSVSIGALKKGSLLTGGWTADGTVRYDITDDGLGSTTWQLTGSPFIS
jgi:hypothetical protein